jgi:hypothetical protein
MMEEGKSAPQISDEKRFMAVAFAVDITYLNDLNMKCQGKGGILCGMFSGIKAFEVKLSLLQKPIGEHHLSHPILFSNLPSDKVIGRC